MHVFYGTEHMARRVRDTSDVPQEATSDHCLFLVVAKFHILGTPFFYFMHSPHYLTLFCVTALPAL